MTQTGLPLRVEDITPEWLTGMFAASHAGVEVLSAQVADVMQGTATKVRVRARFNEVGRNAGLPESFIVKGGFVLHRVLMAQIYRIEQRFYSGVAAELPLETPRSFYAATDAASGQSIVVLEDLDLRAVRFCRVQHPLTLDDAKAQLDAMARMHARWWEARDLKTGGNLNWLLPLDPLPEGEKGAYQRGQLKPATYAQYMQLPRGAAVSRLFHDRDRMERALESLRAFDRQRPWCFLHADYHLGNLYFDADGNPGALDWQSICQGPWSHDYTYFLVSALDMGDRREWEQLLLRHYLDQLTLYGVSAPAFQEAWEAYTRQILYGLYYWLVNPVEFQAEVNNCAVTPRFATAALDHRTLDLLAP